MHSLTDRHMLRHQQKDKEAGGEGLGVVETRKRLWRDADGNIVSKRPVATSLRVVASKEEGLEASSQTQQQRCIDLNGTKEQNHSELLSPPRSMSSTDVHEQTHDLPEFPRDQHFLDPPAGPDMCEFLANSSWDFPLSLEMHPDSPFDDTFKPDTASSFNMPFTTVNNYNWLFGLDDTISIPMGMDAGFPPGGILIQGVPYGSSNNSGSYGPSPTEDIAGNASSTNASTICYHQHHMTTQQDSNSFPSLASREDPSGILQPDKFEGAFSPATSRTHHSPSSVAQRSGGSHPSASASVDLSFTSTGEQPNRRLSESKNLHRQLSDCENFLPSQNRNIRLTIDEVTRKDILDLIYDARPITPDGSHIDENHPFLSVASMQENLDLFFSRFNTVYPLLHQATFDPSRTEPLLVLAVILLGATYSEKDVHMLAVCIHDVLRAQIFQHSAFSAMPELWLLQTILLVECFGKSRAGQKQHDMAHLFHGLLIKYVRTFCLITNRIANTFQPDKKKRLPDGATAKL